MPFLLVQSLHRERREGKGGRFLEVLGFLDFKSSREVTPHHIFCCICLYYVFKLFLIFVRVSIRVLCEKYIFFKKFFDFRLGEWSFEDDVL
jgi:hypothetical protein